MRSDVAVRELALHCLHAVNAAASLPSTALPGPWWASLWTA
ncbi:hypothetical protein IWX75_003571 [Arthrobacter sp. CAN_A6]